MAASELLYWLELIGVSGHLMVILLSINFLPDGFVKCKSCCLEYLMSCAVSFFMPSSANFLSQVLPKMALLILIISGYTSVETK